MKVVVLQLLLIPEKHRAHIGILSTKARSLGGFFPPPKVNDTEISKSLSECLRTFHLAPSKTNSSEEEGRGEERRGEGCCPYYSLRADPDWLIGPMLPPTGMSCVPSCTCVNTRNASECRAQAIIKALILFP